MIDDITSALIQSQAKELEEKYTGLVLVGIISNGALIEGALHFTVSYEGIEEVIEGEYQFDIHIPELYPERLPTVKEIGSKIDKDFHTNPDGTLCLGAPLAMRKAFAENPTLIGFVEKCLIPFLYSYEYRKKHGSLPFGELSHGAEGILEHYKDLLHTDDDLAALGLLRLLADNDYRGHYDCPCGNSMRLRQCHGEQIKELSQYQSRNEYLHDYAQLMIAVNKKKIQVPRALFSKALSKLLNTKELLRKGVIR